MRQLLAIPLAAAVVVAIAGCGEAKIDSSKAEDLVRKAFAKGNLSTKSVTCPDGVKVKKGEDFDCEFVLTDGTAGTITIHQTNNDGSVQTSAADVHVKGR